MIDGHIHIEKGPYTLDWIQKFVDKAVEMGLRESDFWSITTGLKSLFLCMIPCVFTVSM